MHKYKFMFPEINSALKGLILHGWLPSSQITFCLVRGNGSLNSLWPSDTIGHWGSWSTLVQVMVCCLMAPSHYQTNADPSIRSSGKNFRRNCGQNTDIFSQENPIKMLSKTILFWPHCVKLNKTANILHTFIIPVEISLQFDPLVLNDNKSALVQIMGPNTRQAIIWTKDDQVLWCI